MANASRRLRQRRGCPSPPQVAGVTWAAPCFWSREPEDHTDDRWGCGPHTPVVASIVPETIASTSAYETAKSAMARSNESFEPR